MNTDFSDVQHQILSPARAQDPRQTRWLEFRRHIERNGAKSNITRYFPRRKWLFFTILLKLIGFTLWLSRLLVIGERKARDLKLNAFSVEIPGLPEAFERFQIVHISDLHFDRVKGVEEKIVQLLEGSLPDLIVLTGDYKDRMTMPATLYDSAFRTLGTRLKARDGVFATLGNHDTADLLPVMERNGINVLINQSIELSRGTSRMTLTGVDDVHYFYTPEAVRTLEAAPKNPVKVLLVHSPEMALEAEHHGYSLYLCGHTHAGQIATPNGKPVVTHLNAGRKFAVGRWSVNRLQGYTTSGAGVSGLTCRFFTQSEIALITLRSPSV